MAARLVREASVEAEAAAAWYDRSSRASAANLLKQLMLASILLKTGSFRSHPCPAMLAPREENALFYAAFPMTLWSSSALMKLLSLLKRHQKLRHDPQKDGNQEKGDPIELLVEFRIEMIDTTG
jgi:hypothetical protein